MITASDQKFKVTSTAQPAKVTANSPTTVTRSSPMTPEQKKAYRAILRKHLFTPATGVNYNAIHISEHQQAHLTVLAIYGAADKTGLHENKYQCLRLCADGLKYAEIAEIMGIKASTAEQYTLDALNWVVNHTPLDLVKNIPPNFENCIKGGCAECHNDMVFIADHDRWECTRCDFSSEINLLSVFI